MGAKIIKERIAKGSYHWMILLAIILLFLFTVFIAYQIPSAKEWIDNAWEAIENCSISGYVIYAVGNYFNGDTIIKLLQALGLINTFLSSVNAAKEKKVNGIPVARVIKYFYSERHWIYFFQAIFFVFGIICAKTTLRPLAFFALIGAVLCFVYLIRMAMCVVYSEQKINKKICTFIGETIENSKKASVKKENKKNVNSNELDEENLEAKIDSNKIIYELSRRIAEDIAAKKMWGVYEWNEYLNLKYLVKEVINKCNIPGEKSDSISLFNSFERIFAIEESEEEDTDSFNNRCKAIVCEFSRWKWERELFKQNIKESMITWAILFEKAEKTTYQRQIFQAALSCMIEKDNVEKNYSAFLCGLIAYLEVDIEEQTDSNEGIEKKWSEMAYKFLNIVACSEMVTGQGEGNEEERYKIRKELAIVFISFYFILELNFFGKYDMNLIEKNHISEIVGVASKRGEEPSGREISIAIAYAYLIFDAITGTDLDMDSRGVLGAWFDFDQLAEIIKNCIKKY